MCFTGFYWVSVGLTGFDWVLLGFTGFYWVSVGFTGFYWVSVRFIGFYLVLLGFTGFYWVSVRFIGFYLVLLGFTGFQWVLLGFTGLQLVLLGLPYKAYEGTKRGTRTEGVTTRFTTGDPSLNWVFTGFFSEHYRVFPRVYRLKKWVFSFGGPPRLEWFVPVSGAKNETVACCGRRSAVGASHVSANCRRIVADGGGSPPQPPPPPPSPWQPPPPPSPWQPRASRRPGGANDRHVFPSEGPTPFPLKPTFFFFGGNNPVGKKPVDFDFS